MWKKIRILILLSILLIVAVNAYRDQNQNWSKPVMVLLHPINADGLPTTEQYIQQLSVQDLETARDFLQKSAQQYRNQPTYFYFNLGRELKVLPPKVPEQASIFDTVVWSLKFRFYAWKQQQSSDPSASLTLFLNYYDPAQTRQLKHSTALQKGRIGSVNLFASQKQSEQNKIVLVHELLHAFGASDKYDLATGQPIYPIGYAFPDQQPVFPQAKAELMAGHIPLSETTSKMPGSLDQTLINEITAIELGWK
ncbi:hypothetical protein HXZ93_13535 [Acinetobacter pseudolwoffii]|uniref:hypothetical protein n=1 Tax=Acinetobacter pseudolwoffii TaxID=2053287 RepID=UPI002578676C|nr:hypothetical protein [Acinetobacter pseudolwoffii]MDM1337015.1 hypothetical protein [Acinetobacter pseudolwoffii]MDM1343731.1 hypothetical protein [Acinetobacter pseudolwoffii]